MDSGDYCCLGSLITGDEMKLYPIEKSVRILNRWAKSDPDRYLSWTLSSSDQAEDFVVTFFGEVPYFRRYGDEELTAKTFRHALHKAAKSVEGMEPAQPKEGG